MEQVYSLVSAIQITYISLKVKALDKIYKKKLGSLIASSRKERLRTEKKFKGLLAKTSFSLLQDVKY
jgi:hypothetical protein